MKYRLSPFHILLGLMIIALIYYFVFPKGDEYGWGRVFMLFFIPIGVGVFFAVDFIIQYCFKSQKYKYVVLLELFLVALIIWILKK